MAADRTQCINNLKQLGLGMHSHVDTFSKFPVEGLSSVDSWTTQLLPFIEQNTALKSNGKPIPGTYIGILLCPSRGGRDGGMTDYCGAYSESIRNTPPSGNGALNGGSIDGVTINASGYMSILDPIDDNGMGLPGLTMAQVTNGAGTSNTLLLAHTLLNPAFYAISGGRANGGGPNDAGWWETNHSGGCFCDMRWTDSNSGEFHGYIHDSDLQDENHMGGPHYTSAPVAWADGHVTNYPYLYTCCNAKGAKGWEADTAVFQSLWSWNRVENTIPPDN
jgi:prepilin-type processing-associated H-X9-DG protein